MPETLTFEPVDVVMPRGNRLFGGGVHGHAQMPPWPSLFAGAVASRALADAGRIGDITRDPDRAEAILGELLGRSFALCALALARGEELLFPLPADLVALEGEKSLGRDAIPEPARILSRSLGAEFDGVASSAPLRELAVLAHASRKKPLAGQWLTASGLAKHLAGEMPDVAGLVPGSRLWRTDTRLGIALDAGSRTAAESALYTTDAVALCKDLRFVAAFSGEGLPRDGLVRLGGDGRGARIGPASETIRETLSELGRPQPGWNGFQMSLATPGIFPNGWLPPGVDPQSKRLRCNGLEAELVAAVVPRHEVISGWDLAQHQPKPARKVAPAGSVYWFRVLEGDTSALASLRNEGLWPFLQQDSENTARRREGFNRVWFGVWHS